MVVIIEEKEAPYTPVAGEM
jgi:hypothetical protein